MSAEHYRQLNDAADTLAKAGSDDAAQMLRVDVVNRKRSTAANRATDTLTVLSVAAHQYLQDSPSLSQWHQKLAMETVSL